MTPEPTPSPPRGARPATRVGRYVLFEGGAMRRLGLVEWALCALHLKRTVRHPEVDHA